ncbi:MAG: ABC transporter substrate-binding protein [Acidobacteriota bacterium]
MRAEPKTFNPLTAFDNPSLSVLDFLHADLAHLDPRSQKVQPALAESIERSDDGRTYRLTLRPDLTFSDGQPLAVGDVLFTFDALLNPELEAPQRESLLLDGQRPTLTQTGPRSLEIRLPRPHAGGESLLEGVYIVPERALGDAVDRGTVEDAWSLGSPPQDISGLGPFRLREHRPGERLVLERNPFYWKRDAGGTALPYLDEIVIEFAPSPEAEVLRFEAGQADIISGLGAEAFENLSRRFGDSRQLRDLGPGLVYEFLFFNLNDVDAPTLQKKQAWFRNPAFREALSLAIDRGAIARLVYRDRATPVGGHITPANRRFHDPSIAAPATSPDDARRLLEGAGFSWVGEQLHDPSGAPVELTLVTNSSNSRRVETATVIQADLKRLGIALRVVPLDFGALLDRVYDTFDYEIGLLGLGRGGLDPNSSLNVWLSSGDSHLWRLNGDGPDSPWQERLDALLAEQMTELDVDRRRKLLSEIQHEVAGGAPFLFLVAPNVLVGAKEQLGNFRPVAAASSAAWNADHLFWREP